jgi:hypothetical protein
MATAMSWSMNCSVCHERIRVEFPTEFMCLDCLAACPREPYMNFLKACAVLSDIDYKIRKSKFVSPRRRRLTVACMTRCWRETVNAARDNLSWRNVEMSHQPRGISDAAQGPYLASAARARELSSWTALGALAQTSVVRAGHRCRVVNKRG